MSKPQKKEEQHEVPLEEALKLAQGHHQAGNFILAERTYRDILRAVPDHYPTTHFLGVLMFQSGNHDEALTYFKKAIEADDDNSHCYNNYGALLTEKGNYEDAMEAFEKALEIDADYADALDNKTYTLWCLERYEESEALARRVIELNPDSMSAMNSLGMSLVGLEKFGEAIEVWKQASKSFPDQVSVWTNWGNTLREMGLIQESEEKCRKAIDLDPENPDALNNLANALRDRGFAEEAETHYRKLTDLKPDFYLGHGNLAIALMDQEKYHESVIAARYAVAFKKDYAPAYACMGRALSEMGEYDQAHASAQRAVTLEPDEPAHYLDLADILLRADRHDDGVASLEAALKLAPDAPRTLFKLAELYDHMNEPEKALEAIDEAIVLNPDMPNLPMKKAQILSGSDRTEEAIEILSEVLETRPSFIPVMQVKAEMLISVNRNEEAEKLARHVIELNRSLPGPYCTITSLKKFKSEDDEDLLAMLEIEEKVETLGLKRAASLYFALSEVYEQIGDSGKAFHYLKKANDDSRKYVPYDSAKLPRSYQGIKNLYNPGYLEAAAGKGCESDVPIFIVGMPRSGTTLTEQIISSHPDVYGAGELPEIGKVKKMFELGGEEDPKVLGAAYVDMVKARDKTGKALRITDKMPGNYFHLGFIRSILPNAKIIHCRRNPIDTCLSCYKQNFARGQYWSYNLEEMAEEYKRYLDLMDYWRSVLPEGSFLEINYEDTVNDFENQARKLIDYVGMQWHDACLEPHKQKRAVMTASKAQVTKPIYKTSVEKWRRYEKHLQPLVKALLPEEALV